MSSVAVETGFICLKLYTGMIYAENFCSMAQSNSKTPLLGNEEVTEPAVSVK
jgi:hypothetical protein